MDYGKIASFIWDRNPLLRRQVTFEQVINWLKTQYSVVVYDKGEIVGVGLYVVDKRNIHCHFISLSVGKGQTGIDIINRGLKEVIDKVHPKFVSWLNPEFDLITMEI